MDIKIYGLLDPKTSKIRYIGKTTNTLNVRLSKHISSIKYEAPTHRSNWIKSLLEMGLKPNIFLIETCNETNWEDRERFYIKKYKSHLTNTSEGGDTPDPNISRQSAIRMWRNPEYRKKHSGENHHMKKMENRKKVTGSNNGMFGKHHSENAKKRISKKMLGHRQTEHQKNRARIANSRPKSVIHKKNLSKSKSKSLEKYEFIRNEIETHKRTFSEVAKILKVSLGSVWRTYNQKLKCQA